MFDEKKYIAYEEHFVKNFVRINFQERAIFELRSKKRPTFFSRICHDYEKYFSKQYMRAFDANSIDLKFEINLILKQSPQYYFTMAYDQILDKCYVIHEDAIKMLHQTEMPLIILIEPFFSIFQAEAERIKPQRFFLYRRTKQ